MRDFLTAKEILILQEGHRAAQSRKSADRIKTVLLLNEGYSFAEVAKILLLDDTTVRRHIVLYKEQGIDGLLELHYVGSVGLLTRVQEDTLREHLQGKIYETAQEKQQCTLRKHTAQSTHEKG